MRTKLHETEEKLGSYAKEMKSLSDTVDVLGAQVEIYKNDFEAERTARQNIGKYSVFFNFVSTVFKDLPIFSW